MDCGCVAGSFDTSRPWVQRFAVAPSDWDPKNHDHEYSKTIKTRAPQILLCQAQGFSPTCKLLIHLNGKRSQAVKGQMIGAFPSCGSCQAHALQTQQA